MLFAIVSTISAISVLVIETSNFLLCNIIFFIFLIYSAFDLIFQVEELTSILTVSSAITFTDL